MKITIVCGHFIPAMGYIEVHLARAFAEMGHDVTVVTSTEIPAYVSHLHQDFGEAPEGLKVVRLKPKFTLGQVVIADGVKEAVLTSNPDQIIVVGLGKRFPKKALGLGIHTTALFGDNAASYGDSPSIKTRLLFELFKRGTYQKAIEKADRLVAYTPESFEAAGKMLGGRWAKMADEQKDFISLGFHPAEFYYREELRLRKRGELGLEEGDHVVITATRIRPEKELEKVITAFTKSPESVKWLLVGSAGDEYAAWLSKKLASALGKNRFNMLPHQPRKELNGFYNAADVALFTAPAISVIEAMGTGLPVILPDVKSLSHLVRNPDSGQYVGDFDSFILPLYDVHHRSQRAKNNRASLSWERQARMLLL